MSDDLITVQAAADYLKISDRTVRNYFKENKIQHIRMSERIILTKKEWLDDFIERSTQKPIIKENEQ